MDSSYEASKDPNKQYSSLALIKPSINSSGVYKCIVQTKLETITINKIVQVIDIRNYTLHLNRYKIQNQTQLVCSISNVFPKPILTITYVTYYSCSERYINILIISLYLYLLFRSEDSEILKVSAQDPHQNDEGYFNTTTIAAVDDNDEDSDSYGCIVNFDGYSKNLTTTITSGTCKIDFYFRLLYICMFLRILFSKSVFNL